MLVAIIAAAAVSAGSIAWAAIPDSSGLIHTCYKKPGDTLRVADDSGGCGNDEVALSWLGLRGFYTNEGPRLIAPTPPGQAQSGTLFCHFGDHVMGGGFDAGPDPTGLSVVGEELAILDETEGWRITFRNTSSNDIPVTVQTICADVTP